MGNVGDRTDSGEGPGTPAGCICGRSGEVARVAAVDCFSERTVLQCMRCGTLQMRPQVGQEQLERYFEDEYFEEKEPSYWGPRREPIFAQIADSLREQGVTSVLDIGSGYGHLVAYLDRRGFRATGCDLSAEAVRAGRKALQVDIRRATVEELQLSRRHALTLIDTLYYVPDPEVHLLACRRHCSPGGILLLRVRNPDGLFTRQGLPCPHLWGFSPDGLIELLDRTGWETEHVAPGAASRHATRAPRMALRAVNRTVRSVRPSTGIWTHSYHVVARRS